MKYIFPLLIVCIFSSCISRKWNYPSYYHKGKVTLINDSINIKITNPIKAPIRFNISSSIKEVDSILNSFRLYPAQPLETIVLKFKKTNLDLNTIRKSLSYKSIVGQKNDIKIDTSTRYHLPILKGRSSEIIQGYNGTFTHNSGFSKYAIDFRMKLGDTICAAKKGIVVGIINQNKKGGRSKRFLKFVNLITIYHDDGTFSEYDHVVCKGNLVNVGDFVNAGQPIAICGLTGRTTTPHLHFVAYKPNTRSRESFPVKFHEIDGFDLKKGVTIKRKK